MDLLLPLPVRVSKISLVPLSNTAASPSIFSGAMRTLSRSGDRFGFDITVSQASDKEAFPMRSALRNVRSGLRGQTNRIWFADPSYKLRGAFPTGEILPNGYFSFGSSNWGTSAAALSVADGYARVQNAGSASGYAVNATAATLAAGASYVARAFLYPGNQASWKVNGGTTSGASDVFASGALTTGGLFIQAFTASGSGGAGVTMDDLSVTMDSTSVTLDSGGGGASSFFLSLLCGTTTAADFVHYMLASVSRCALVNGGAQTGANLNIQALPATTAGLLLPGDRVQIGTQINTVVAPLNSDGSGLGYLQCALPWRVSPANGAAVIIDKPMARCYLTSITAGWDESPGGFADFNLQIQESLDL